MKIRITFVMVLLFLSAAFADETSVSINAPVSAQKGTSITVTIAVTHKGNNILHFTDWVVLKVNGNEVKRWEYRFNERPDSEDFSVQYQLKVEETLQLEAQGHCNIHGSTGAVSTTVKVKE